MLIVTTVVNADSTSDGNAYWSLGVRVVDTSEASDDVDHDRSVSDYHVIRTRSVRI